MNAPDRPLTPQAGVVFRRVTLTFAGLLAVLGLWLLLAELTRPAIHGLPADADSVAAAGKQRWQAALAASFGIVRGDLWADSAFTHADLLWNDNESSGWLIQALDHARTSLERALDDAPHQSGAWLMLAGLGSRYSSLNLNATQALKMSYYTGPSEEDLMLPRLRVAAQSDFLDDVEIREFVTRDLRLLLARHQKSAIDDAYNGGSVTGKAFIKQVVGQISTPAPAVPQRRPALAARMYAAVSANTWMGTANNSSPSTPRTTTLQPIHWSSGPVARSIAMSSASRRASSSVGSSRPRTSCRQRCWLTRSKKYRVIVQLLAGAEC